MRYYELVNLMEDSLPSTQIGQNMALPGSVSTDSRYTAQHDQINKKEMHDTRKPKITLRMLNRLKMIRAAKKLEMAEKSKMLGVMYASPAEEAGGL